MQVELKLVVQDNAQVFGISTVSVTVSFKQMVHSDVLIQGAYALGMQQYIGIAIYCNIFFCNTNTIRLIVYCNTIVHCKFVTSF